MYSHVSKRTVASRACPGVSFTIRRISYGRRNAIASRLALPEGAEKTGDLANVGEAVQLIRALIEAMLLDLSGLEVDGRPFGGRFAGEDKPGAIEELLDTAPEKLIEEIFAALLEELRLDGEAEKNSAPPSGTPRAETEGGLTAATANRTGYGPGAIAGAATPAA